jgi:hypothetical protein
VPQEAESTFSISKIHRLHRVSGSNFHQDFFVNGDFDLTSSQLTPSVPLTSPPFTKFLLRIVGQSSVVEILNKGFGSPGVARFSRYNIPKRVKYSKLPWHIPSGQKYTK